MNLYDRIRCLGSRIMVLYTLGVGNVKKVPEEI